MSSQISPLATPSPWNIVADGYAAAMQPVLEEYAGDAIGIVQPARDARVLDVAAGPGTLSFLLEDRVARVDAIDFSDQMLANLKRRAARARIRNIFPAAMDGQSLTFADASFDAAFSMFGLMLFPDRIQGLREMHRVLKARGRCAVSCWTPIARSPLMYHILETLSVMVDQPDLLDSKGNGITDREELEAELRVAEFEDVEVHTLSHVTPMRDADSYWEFMLTSAAPIALLKHSLRDEEWADKCQGALAHLRGLFPRGPIELGTEAYLATGTRP